MEHIWTDVTYRITNKKKTKKKQKLEHAQYKCPYFFFGGKIFNLWKAHVMNN